METQNPASDEWRCDSTILNEIQKTHSIDAKSIPETDALMKIVENTLNVSSKLYEPNGQEKSALGALGPIIHKISCEVSSNCSETQDTLEQRTVKLFRSLEKFNWDSKIAITLAGFAANYAEFFLTDEVYTKNTAAMGLLQLKRLGQKDIGNNGDTVIEIVTKMTCIAKNILSLKIIQDNYPSTIPIDITDYQSASYWIIYVILMCSLEISGQRVLVDSIKGKIDGIGSHFSLKLKQSQEHEQEQKNFKEQYESYVRIFCRRHDNNVAILEPLLNCKEDEELIYSKDPKKNIKLKDLANGSVIIVLSSFNIDVYREEVSLIEAFSNKTNIDGRYHIVWLPIGQCQKEAYATLVSNKPWYYLKFESMEKQTGVLKQYARKEWGFDEKPMMMVLDNGEVIHHDALSLILTWGNRAIPFKRDQEKTLWSDGGNNLRFNFLLDYLHDDFTKAEDKGISKYVCVFGGRRLQKSGVADEKWFADLVGKLMKAANCWNNIKLNMAYLSANKEEVNLETKIKKEVRDKIKKSKDGEQRLKYVDAHYVDVDQVSTVNLFWSRIRNIMFQLSILNENKTLEGNMKTLLDTTSGVVKYSSLQSTAWVLIGEPVSNQMFICGAELFSECMEQIINYNKDGFTYTFRKLLENKGWKNNVELEGKHCFKHVVYGDGMKMGGMKCVICKKAMKMVALCCE
ncbi:sieve element occlusion protein [Rhynchospora pubera]|uniref:Sieve element occlusion protein n=1 Tax=Rhynchospora pubera TaxID=906938 RepID=A0AAV8H6G5_9POAL|nr:sieve element occlusion protein [Rhynchospora pubera]KAJ4812939.1 sieve element occlusion protein [Rhynchospora pubera]